MKYFLYLIATVVSGILYLDGFLRPWTGWAFIILCICAFMFLVHYVVSRGKGY